MKIAEEATRGYWRVEFVKATDPTRAVTLVGSREGLVEMSGLISLVAPTDARVLITGETGTGKNSVAEVLHLLHPTRWEHPFRRTNLGALVPELAASQLFGHAKGAFTGAERDALGVVREADRGTLFLDQLADAPRNVQDMLLTLLEVKRINPVGAYGRESGFPVDIRVVSATLETPEELLAQKKMREDLFYRIMEYHIHLPSLRTRPREVMPLATYFLEKSADLRQASSMSQITDFEPAAVDAILAYSWPGNVRELEHVIRAAIVASRVDPSALRLRREWLRIPGRLSSAQEGYREALDRFKHEWANRVLDMCAGNNKKAAEMMGISQDTFRKIRQWDPGGHPESDRLVWSNRR